MLPKEEYVQVNPRVNLLHDFLLGKIIVIHCYLSLKKSNAAYVITASLVITLGRTLSKSDYFLILTLGFPGFKITLPSGSVKLKLTG